MTTTKYFIATIQCHSLGIDPITRVFATTGDRETVRKWVNFLSWQLVTCEQTRGFLPQGIPVIDIDPKLDNFPTTH